MRNFLILFILLFNICALTSNVEGKRRKEIVDKYDFKQAPTLLAQADQKKPITNPLPTKEVKPETTEAVSPEDVTNEKDLNDTTPAPAIQEGEDTQTGATTQGVNKNAGDNEKDETTVDADGEEIKDDIKDDLVKKDKDEALKEDEDIVEDIEDIAKKAPEKEEPKNGNDIFLNFENADLKSFVDYMGNLKKINVYTDPKIAGNKISLSIREPLSLEGAWKAFLTILEMSGFSIINVDGLYRVVPKATKYFEPLPIYIKTPPEKLPDSDITIRYVTFLTNITTGKVQELLRSMLSPNSGLIQHSAANGFVITDKSYNIKAAMSVIQELDRSDVKQAVTVMRLKRANADDVKDLLDRLIGQKEKISPLARLLGRTTESSAEYFPSATKIIKEPRTNSLILLGDIKAIKKIEDFIINHVDTELKGVKSPLHVYELQHMDVEQIKDVLEKVVGSGEEGGGEASAISKYGGIRGGVKYFKKMKFEIDKSGNRLIAHSTDDQDWKLLKKTIKNLDKPQPQVAIETLIVGVDFDDTKQIGSQIRNKKYGQFGSNINAQAANLESVVFQKDANGNNVSILGDLLQKMTFGIGSTVLTFGKLGNVWGMVQLLKSQVNTSVLYQPFVVAKNMRQATVEVGETRRVQMQRAISDQGSTGSASGYKDDKETITLKVKPQINLDGIINLDIDVSIKEFVPTSADPTRPDTTNRTFNTKASVANGQVLVLGGFVKTKVLEDNYRTPLLSRVPILGWLFKSKNRQITKQYIFVFMSPTILKSRTTPGTNLYTKMKLHQVKSDIEDSIQVGKTCDPIHNWFFGSDDKNYKKNDLYSHKVVDFANARYQPASVDIINDPYYRAKTLREMKEEEGKNEDQTPTPPNSVDKK